MRPQAFGSYFSKLGNRSCAVGAAGEGVGVWNAFASDGHRSEDLTEVLGIPPKTKCPLCRKSSTQYKKHNIEFLPEHLNDAHRLTRPATAYLLYGIERAEKGGDPLDDQLFKEIFGPLEEMDGVAEAIDPKMTKALTR